jgi:hypothetical protein
MDEINCNSHNIVEDKLTWDWALSDPRHKMQFSSVFALVWNKQDGLSPKSRTISGKGKIEPKNCFKLFSTLIKVYSFFALFVLCYFRLFLFWISLIDNISFKAIQLFLIPKLVKLNIKSIICYLLSRGLKDWNKFLCVS